MRRPPPRSNLTYTLFPSTTLVRSLRVCKHCRIEKPLTEFVRQKGYWMHKCTSCKKAHRRVQYHNREGEYANLDTEAERAKRRESGRQARGRYVWDESWLKKRQIGRAHV